MKKIIILLLLLAVNIDCQGVRKKQPIYRDYSNQVLPDYDNYINRLSNESQNTSYIIDTRANQYSPEALKKSTDNTLIIAGSIVLVGLFLSFAIYLGLRNKSTSKGPDTA
jgi:predicted PurR-regulated permease PerM